MKMRTRFLHLRWLAACLPLLSMSLGPSAQVPQTPPGPQAPAAPLSGLGLIVTYLEAPLAKSAALSADLKAYAGQIEDGPAKPRVTILSELGRPNRMVVMEQWADLSAPDFAKAETLLIAKTQPDVQAPIDRRMNHPITPTLAEAPAEYFPSKAFIVLMHMDIGRGDGADQVPKMLQAQQDAVLAAKNSLGYEVAIQDQHTNHFAVCEVWKSRAAYEAYTATAPAEDLRRKLASLIGSPFDDRFYATVEH